MRGKNIPVDGQGDGAGRFDDVGVIGGLWATGCRYGVEVLFKGALD